MPTNFLANLGTGLRNFGGFLSPEFSAGANLGAGLRDRFKKRPGEPGSSPMTPTSPTPMSPASATDMLEGATAAGEESARSKLPINAPAYPDPMNELVRGELNAANPVPELPNVSPRSQIPLNATSPPTVPNMPAPAFEPSTLRDYRGRDISSDRVGFERDIYMRGKTQPGGGFKRSLGMTLRNAMLGASNALQRGGGVEGAIGGALAGAGGSLINPRAGYEAGFELGERPRIEADIKRGREEEAYQRAGRMAGYDESLKRGELDMLPIQADQERAQTEQMRANVDIARQNAARQQSLTDSQIKLNEARTEAAKTGTPKIVDVQNPETGAIETVMVFPGGGAQTIGQSGRAAINLQNTRSREKIAGQREAGQDKRAQMRIDAGEQSGPGGESKLRKPSSGNTATMSKLREFYKAKGVTDDAEIRRRAKDLGFTVKD